jgi:glycosyltransferase involved in cell wall biosynthesis
MRILVDYRPALRERTGVGEYMHQLVRAYAAHGDDEVAVLTSSWKDRPPPGLGAELHARVIDRRIPVRLLNYAWHRLEWPPVEALAGRCDVVHAAHPLLIPARAAAQVITIHDLFFLSEPERTRAEIRRDYVPLARAHARRADAVITSTEHGKRLVASRLGVREERIYVCPPGPPVWQRLGREARVPSDGTILFLGTLEPRKNLGTLLDAYEALLRRGPRAPRLVIAGRATRDAAPWLERMARPPLASHVSHLGYVTADQREQLYAAARMLVLPSLDEGFGLPALEAMSAGVPVVVSNRGSLPEVVGTAGTLVEPDDVAGLTAAIERLAADDVLALDRARAGLARAREFAWPRAAATLRQAYAEAVTRRQERARRTGPERAR